MIKYVLKNDLYYGLNKYKKYTIIFCLTLMILLFVKSFGIKNYNNLYYEIVGFEFNLVDFVSSLLFIFNIGFSFYITLTLFLNDLKNDMDNLFLRVDVVKWLFTKILSIFIVQSIIKIILFILLYLEIIVLKGVVDNLLVVFIVNIIFTMLLNLLFLLLFVITKKYKLLSILFLIFFVVIFRNEINYSLIANNISIMLVIIFIILIVMNLFIKKNYNCIFENTN